MTGTHQPKRLDRRTLLKGLAIGAGSFALPFAKAQAAQKFTHWKIGDFTVTKIPDGIQRLPAAKVFPGAPADYVTRNLDWIAPDYYDPQTNDLIFSIHSYLIQTPHGIVLVDTCMGDDKPRGSPVMPDRVKGPWFQNMRDAGFRLGDVKRVVCTHLHADHIGYNTLLREGSWVPSFPNARYFFSKIDVANAQAPRSDGRPPDVAFMDSVKPVIDAGLANLAEGEVVIQEGVKLIPAPGHTPGHYSVELTSRGKKAVMTGDAWHSPMEIVNPQQRTILDGPPTAVEGRNMIFDKYADKDVLLFTAHHAGRTAGHIVTVPGRGRIFRTLV